MLPHLIRPLSRAPRPCPKRRTTQARKDNTLNDIPDNTPAAPPPLAADTRGSDFEMPTYDIAPEDQALADEIASFDPVYDTKGPTTFSGSVKLPETIKATGLPPHLRDPIVAQLATVPESRREAEERRLVYAALYQNSLGLRIVAGPGAGANTYERAALALTFDMEETEREIDRLGRQLGEMAETATVSYDPATGQQRVQTAHRFQGERRAGLEAEYRRALHKLAQLNGIEGERRLAKALSEAVQERKALQQQLDDDREARERAEKLLREERVSERAALFAKHKRTTH